MKTEILQANEENIVKCAEFIKNGGIVAFPTETVYGLGACAFDEKATEKIFVAKGRPATNPLIIHVSEKSQIDTVAEVSEQARRLIDALMPGAFTLVLPKKSIVPSIVTAGFDTVAVRMPDHEVALALINAVGKPICAPSANSSARPSPTTAMHVYEDLCGNIPYILDGGKCPFGVESTIIDMTQTPPKVLRAGSVDISRVEDIIGEIDKSSKIIDQLADSKTPMNFMPRAELTFSAYYEGMDRTICEYYDSLSKQGRKPIIFCLSKNASLYGDRRVMEMGKTVKEYASRLFETVREAERTYDSIIAEGVPFGGIGTTLLARLMKMSNGNVI